MRLKTELNKTTNKMKAALAKDKFNFYNIDFADFEW